MSQREERGVETNAGCSRCQVLNCARCAEQISDFARRSQQDHDAELAAKDARIAELEIELRGRGCSGPVAGTRQVDTDGSKPGREYDEESEQFAKRQVAFGESWRIVAVLKYNNKQQADEIARLRGLLEKAEGPLSKLVGRKDVICGWCPESALEGLDANVIEQGLIDAEEALTVIRAEVKP